MRYMVTFTINIPQMLAYIPYMDPMGYGFILVDGRHLLFLRKCQSILNIWIQPSQMTAIFRFTFSFNTNTSARERELETPANKNTDTHKDVIDDVEH